MERENVGTQIGDKSTAVVAAHVLTQSVRVTNDSDNSGTLLLRLIFRPRVCIRNKTDAENTVLKDSCNYIVGRNKTDAEITSLKDSSHFRVGLNATHTENTAQRDSCHSRVGRNETDARDTVVKDSCHGGVCKAISQQVDEDPSGNGGIVNVGRDVDDVCKISKVRSELNVLEPSKEIKKCASQRPSQRLGLTAAQR